MFSWKGLNVREKVWHVSWSYSQPQESWSYVYVHDYAWQISNFAKSVWVTLIQFLEVKNTLFL